MRRKIHEQHLSGATSRQRIIGNIDRSTEQRHRPSAVISEIPKAAISRKYTITRIDGKECCQARPRRELHILTSGMHRVARDGEKFSR